MTQLTPELEASLRIAINPLYADQPGTESHERADLLGEIDRLRAISASIMTPAEITTLLEAWRNERAALDIQLNALNAVLSPEPGNKLGHAIEVIFSAYTDTLSTLIGDKGEWLFWYWLERDMGAKPGEVIPEKGAAPIVCGTDLAALVSVITWGRT
jgi:hypothetical protein